MILTELLDDLLVSVVFLNGDGLGLEVLVLAKNPLDLALEVFQNHGSDSLANFLGAAGDSGVGLGVLLDGKPSGSVDLSRGREDSF